MLTLPSSSNILLIPTGDEWSTVDKETFDVLITLGYVPGDKERICRWLFNAKTIEIHTKIGNHDPELEIDKTVTINAGIILTGDDGDEVVLAADHPLPWNDTGTAIDTGNDVISCWALSASSVHSRWIEDGKTTNDFSFSAFVYLGVWYWAPGSWADDQEVSELGENSFTITGLYENDEEQPLEITTTIKKTFYPLPS